MILIKPGYAGTTFFLDDDAIIADVGFGYDPVRHGTYYIDRDLAESPDRAGLAAGTVPEDRFIQADVEQGIPLPDKSCDFVVASHIVEHMNDPEFFCKELSRVGKKGYIETPRVITELCNNKAVHKWFVWKFQGTLYFIRKPGIFKNEWDLSGPLFVVIRHVFRQMCFPWEGEISCKVIK